jgi:hypothetical protein
MRAGRLAAVATLGCLWLLPATASATHVQCGDTITQTTVLDSDVVCTAQDPVGLVIGGDNLRLQLADHTIQGAGGTDGIVDDGSAHTGVDIRRGQITGFEDGIDLDVSDSRILKVGVAASGVGITLRGNGNYLHKNPITMTTGSGFAGIEVAGDDSYLWHNWVTGTAATLDDGIVVHGNRPRIVLNSVDGCAFDGVLLDGYFEGIAALNNVTNCDIGFNPSGTGLAIQSNIASGNCLGMVVDDPAALVRWNTANSNCFRGIVVMQAGAALRKNITNDNGEVGIDAPDGTIDEGGNVATGNPVDCLGVVCLSLPPT